MNCVHTKPSLSVFLSCSIQNRATRQTGSQEGTPWGWRGEVGVLAPHLLLAAFSSLWEATPEGSRWGCGV